MKIPTIIELCGKTSYVLSKTLLASIPDEGCAILIGQEENCQKKAETQLKIHTIWPCMNRWEQGLFNRFQAQEKNILNLSKRNRFSIDPREQILAQKWARSNKLKVLGIAHSHPNSEAIPSKLDLDLSFNLNLMLIMDKNANIRAWWITNNQQFKEIRVTFSEGKNIIKV
tara:strand:+ start:92 stop:601 length:510 start_codon:yes stop_codon:yes gene_type:complete